MIVLNYQKKYMGMFIFRYVINFLRNIRINRICRKYGITNYTINPDGSIDVDNNVSISYRKLYRLPLKFNKISGWFDCSYNKLTNLDGFPNYVGDWCDCTHNELTSLEGAPKEIGGNFRCYLNNLTDLKGCPKVINGYFDCSNNKLTSLVGCPNYLDGGFSCGDNNLTSLEGCPSDVGGVFLHSYNPISPIIDLFDDIKIYLEYQETYNFLRKDSKIVKHLLDEALRDYNEYYNKNIRLPKSFYRYVYI